MIVDVHAHLFNADDLPVSGFVSHHELLRDFVFSPALAELLDRFVQGRAPDVQTDRQRLEALLAGLETASLAPQPALRAEEIAVSDALDADDELRVRVEAAVRQLDAEATGADVEAIGPADLGRVVRWVSLFTQSRVDLPGQYAASSGSGVNLVIPMMVDLDAGTDDQSESTQSEQVEVFELVSLASMRGLLPDAGQLAVHPGVAFDPLRQLRHTGPDESPLELVQRAVLSHGFVGVKVYPPMGWMPAGNAARTDLPPGDGQRLDDIVKELADWCVAHDVPVIAHANRSNSTSPGFEDFGAPERWKQLLRACPGLRLNLGHFGGIHPARKDYGWTIDIAALMAEFDFVYADVSCQRVENPEVLAGHLAVMRELQDAGRPITTRVMVGTDWYLQAINPDPEAFLATYRAAWLDEFGEAATADFLSGNALRFMGFADRTNQNAQRLRQRYDDAEVARPGWLVSGAGS